MSVGFDPNSDFEMICDGLEAVTLKHRKSSSESIATALQRSLNTREIAASDGKYVSGDVRWHLPDALVTKAPRLGDTIIDAGDRYYTILDAQHATLENRWRCIARDVAVVYGLDDTVEILEATYAKGTAGADEPTWATKWTGVRARVQPLATDIAVEHEARRTRTTHQVFITEDLDITDKHRVKDKAGTVYRVTGYTRAERIGELQTIDAEETPWPLA